MNPVRLQEALKGRMTIEPRYCLSTANRQQKA